MKLYGRIDLGSDDSVVGLTDEQENVLYLQRLGNSPAVILGELARVRLT